MSPEVVGGDWPRGEMHLSAVQEMFSLAYVHAVVAAARCATATPRPDVVGVDLSVLQERAGDPPGFAQLDLQVKCTFQNDAVAEQSVKHRLMKNHYDALRTERVSWPRILVVVVVPRDLENWLHQSEDEMRLLRCGYWISLRGQDDIGTNSTTVTIPRRNQFTIDAVCRLLHEAAIAAGGTA